MPIFIAWRTARSERIGCGVFISERWPSTSVSRIAEVDVDPLDADVRADHQHARGYRRSQAGGQFRLDRDVPAKVVVAGLDHGAGGRGGIPPALMMTFSKNGLFGSR